MTGDRFKLIVGIAFLASCFVVSQSAAVIIPPNVTAKKSAYETYGGKPTFFKYLSFIVRAEPRPNMYGCTVNASLYSNNLTEIERTCLERVRNYEHGHHGGELSPLPPRAMAPSYRDPETQYVIDFPRNEQRLSPNESWYTYVSPKLCVGDHYIFAIYDGDNDTVHTLMHEPVPRPSAPDLDIAEIDPNGGICDRVTIHRPDSVECRDIRYNIHVGECWNVRRQTCEACDDANNTSPGKPCCFNHCTDSKLEYFESMTRTTAREWSCGGRWKRSGDTTEVANETVVVRNNTVQVIATVLINGVPGQTSMKFMVFNYTSPTTTTTTAPSTTTGSSSTSNNCNSLDVGKIVPIMSLLVLLLILVQLN